MARVSFYVMEIKSCDVEYMNNSTKTQRKPNCISKLLARARRTFIYIRHWSRMEKNERLQFIC